MASSAKIPNGHLADEKSQTSLPPQDDVGCDSYHRTIARFDASKVAGNYPSNYGNSFRERREVAAIRRTLRAVPKDAKVLDLPCGTGRLIPHLVEKNFRVTAADASPHMVALAEQNWLQTPQGAFSQANPVKFLVREVLDTGFPDQHFDAVFCNRLFHHFNEPETRIAALTELRRICRGVVIVSFFNTFALDAVKFRWKHALRRTTPTDRIPIPSRILENEADSADLEVVSRNAVMWGLSPMWYLTLKRK